MSSEKEVREMLEQVKRKLMVMDWDKARNQLNAGKMGIYNSLSEQKTKLESELTQFSSTEELIEANSVTKSE
jgi:hypothetical protein